MLYQAGNLQPKIESDNVV